MKKSLMKSIGCVILHQLPKNQFPGLHVISFQSPYVGAAILFLIFVWRYWGSFYSHFRSSPILTVGIIGGNSQSKGLKHMDGRFWSATLLIAISF